MPDQELPHLGARLAGLAASAALASEPPPVTAIRSRAGRRRAARRLTSGALLVTAIVATVSMPLGSRERPTPPPPAVGDHRTDTPSPSTPATDAGTLTPAPPTTPAAPSSAPATSTATAVPDRSVTSAGDPPATSTPPRSTSVVECRLASGLKVTAGMDQAGSGHRSLQLVFTNGGSTPCRMRGYPGVAAVDAAGTQTAQARRTPGGYLGGGTVTSLTLAVGQSSSAVVEAVAFNRDGTSCTPYAGLVVTPPDDTRLAPVAWRTDACADLEVHPVTTPP